ncbi:hypothetical protein DSS3PM1_00103 [Bacteriophage DSS3_PM1]|uniref:Uncharacterized protein n=1 Tax=Bacteriophage DSS3_VP1 TaxID=2664196 RepID=A0A7S5FQC2_9CAUD|nr:hypothetical protein KNU84_gp065 [Bacteriophage DSS3_VP1]QGH74639.1 hypothetical protein DSS3VP1_00071 [Bacteriophage DSS3_VP1]QGH74779.1 hypothetical protein DSS3PM1_00103 [Bacteriophage DSS3_PM1]
MSNHKTKEYRLEIEALPRLDSIVKDVIDSVQDGKEGQIVITRRSEVHDVEFERDAYEAFIGHVCQQVVSQMKFNLKEVRSYDS